MSEILKKHFKLLSLTSSGINLPNVTSIIMQFISKPRFNITIKN